VLANGVHNTVYRRRKWEGVKEREKDVKKDEQRNKDINTNLLFHTIYSRF
jgi:hypothetical protein